MNDPKKYNTRALLYFAVIFTFLYAIGIFYPHQIINFLKHRSIQKFFFRNLSRSLPIFLLIPTVLSLDHNWKSRFFDWKIIFIAWFFIIFFCIFQLLTGPDRTLFFGVRWKWSAFITYLILFLAQIILYQRKGINNFQSVLLSFSGCKIAGIIYEIRPWIDQLNVFFSLQVIVSFHIFLLILYHYRWKPPKYFWLMIIPLIIEFMFYWDLPYWSLRLATFPMMLIIPFGLKREVTAC